eukprot:1416923-Heterocapsa_arctica.AAC.1
MAAASETVLHIPLFFSGLHFPHVPLYTRPSPGPSRAWVGASPILSPACGFGLLPGGGISTSSFIPTSCRVKDV